MHRTLTGAQQEAANHICWGCIALLGVQVRHIALGVAGVHCTGLGVAGERHIVLEVAGEHHIVLKVGEVHHHIVLQVEVTVGQQEIDHSEYEPHSLVAGVENGIALLVGTVLVVEPHTALVCGEVVRMATAGVAVAVAVAVGVVGSHIAD